MLSSSDIRNEKSPHQYQHGLIKEIKSLNAHSIYVLQYRDSEWLSYLMKALRRKFNKAKGVKITSTITPEHNFCLYIEHEYSEMYNDNTLNNIVMKLERCREDAISLCEKFDLVMAKARGHLKLYQDNE